MTPSVPAESYTASAVLLAGGLSSRMGTNKALLRFDDGTTVIERIANVAAQACDEVVLVTNTPADYAFLHLPTVIDAYPGAGSLGGICTGLLHSSRPRVLALSCDVPLVQVGLLRYLLGRQIDQDFVVPLVAGRQQPLLAVYAKTCLPVMRAQIEAGDLMVRHALQKLHGSVLPQEELRPEWLPSFHNMNTPQDWEALRTLPPGGD